jgi:hypothetical protein
MLQTNIVEKAKNFHFMFNTYRFSTATLVTRTSLCYVVRTVKAKLKVKVMVNFTL